LAETFLEGGLNLYDVQPCDGAIINARVLDTVFSYGVCFSPDNKFLYSTRKEYQTGNFESSEIVQWDVSQPNDLNQIKQSEYVVLINSAHQYPAVMRQSAYMGDLRIGKDQKMYVPANLRYRSSLNPYPVFPSVTVPDSQVLHIIHQPNVQGMGCQVERDGFPIRGDRQNRAYYWLPHTIYEVPKQLPDTIYKAPDSFYNCFNRGIYLNIPNKATCIAWYNGNDQASIYTKDTGLLWVRYAIDCQWYVDSFYSLYVPPPYLPQKIMACEYNGAIQLQQPRSNLSYHYTLVNEAYGWERKASTNPTDTFWAFDNLPSGDYSLHIRAGQCDTTIFLSITVFPKAQLNIHSDHDTLWMGQTTYLEASGAYLYTWFPHLGLDTTMGSKVLASPPYSMQYEVIGINDYGCRDTAYIQLIVQDSLYIWLPNAFSPNYDGLNDAVGLYMSPHIKLLRWVVYNRWGQAVFFTQDANAKWDGSFKGQTATIGVYYYMIEYVHQQQGQVKQQKGELHLIR
jgi:gliding motility-associated-like protein